MLDKKLSSILDNRKLDDFKLISWGCGESGQTFLKNNTDIEFSYLVDTRSEFQKTTVNGLRVESEEVLFSENAEDTIIFLPTVIHQRLKGELKAHGFKHIVVPNQINQSGVGITIPRRRIHDFVDWINDQKINYVSQKLLFEDEGLEKSRDLDLLVSNLDLEALINCPIFQDITLDKDEISVDISWSHPIGLNNELPFLPADLAEAALQTKSKNNKTKLYQASDEVLFYMYLYHAFVHKPEFMLKLKSKRALKYLIQKLGLNLKIEQENLLQFLLNGKFPPPIDFVRKWSHKVNSNLWNDIYPLVLNKKNGVSVLILRSWFDENEKAIHDVLNLIRENNYFIEEMLDLKSGDSENIIKRIRGGVWFDSTRSSEGGLPSLGLVLRSDSQNIRNLKEKIRQVCSDINGNLINVAHSSDDCAEAEEYLKIFGQSKCISIRSIYINDG